MYFSKNYRRFWDSLENSQRGPRKRCVTIFEVFGTRFGKDHERRTVQFCNGCDPLHSVITYTYMQIAGLKEMFLICC